MRIAVQLKRINLRLLIIVSITTLLGMWAIEATLAANGSVAYTYDALGRIATASYDTGACVIFVYDANGNRLSETVLVSGSGSGGVWGCFNWGQRNWGP
jgi:hypothetical protein